MENTKTIVLQFKMTRNRLLGLLTLFFMAWHPAFIESETLTLTTYYPAPYGGYASLLTTGQTLLARDGGNVGVGTGTPGSKFHVLGASRMDGALALNGAFTLVNGTQANTRVLTSDAGGNATWMDGGGPLECTWVNYNAGSTTNCPVNGTQVVMSVRDAAGTMGPLGPPTSVPQSGAMFCCKIKP